MVSGDDVTRLCVKPLDYARHGECEPQTEAGPAAALIGFFQLGGSALSSLAVGFLQAQGVSSYSAMALIMFLFVTLALANIHHIQRGR